MSAMSYDSNLVVLYPHSYAGSNCNTNRITFYPLGERELGEPFFDLRLEPWEKFMDDLKDVADLGASKNTYP